MIEDMNMDWQGYSEIYKDDKFHSLKIYRKTDSNSSFPWFRTTMQIEGVCPNQIAELFSDEKIHEQSEWSQACVSCKRITSQL